MVMSYCVQHIYSPGEVISIEVLPWYSSLALVSEIFGIQLWFDVNSGLFNCWEILLLMVTRDCYVYFCAAWFFIHMQKCNLQVPGKRLKILLMMIFLAPQEGNFQMLLSLLHQTQKFWRLWWWSCGPLWASSLHKILIFFSNSFISYVCHLINMFSYLFYVFRYSDGHEFI